MISVSHRHHLRRFHRSVLSVLGDGRGGWALTDIAAQCVLPLLDGDPAQETGAALEARHQAREQHLNSLRRAQLDRAKQETAAANGPITPLPGGTGADADVHETPGGTRAVRVD
eukprot:COSAG01_NODE_8819_length_2649_cov_3.510588_2_plen_114_part_00